MEKIIIVNDMDCMQCSAQIENKLKLLGADFQISLHNKEIKIKNSNQQLDKTILQAIKELGFTPKLKN